MKYEVINPSDRCFITSDVPFAAAMACFLLGNGAYGLRDENDEKFITPFIPIETQLEISPDDLPRFIDKHRTDIYNCLRSFEYSGEPTSCNDIGGRAKAYADNLEKNINK